jgi:hypothetical protein
MTAHFIANILENQSNLDRFSFGLNLLESHIRRNFSNFKETELVYKWAKDLCDSRNNLYNDYRASGWYYGDFENFLKTKGFALQNNRFTKRQLLA